jgi:hypothetical protein
MPKPPPPAVPAVVLPTLPLPPPPPQARQHGPAAHGRRCAAGQRQRRSLRAARPVPAPSVHRCAGRQLCRHGLQGMTTPRIPPLTREQQWPPPSLSMSPSFHFFPCGLLLRTDCPNLRPLYLPQPYCPALLAQPTPRLTALQPLPAHLSQRYRFDAPPPPRLHAPPPLQPPPLLNNLCAPLQPLLLVLNPGPLPFRVARVDCH